MVTGKIVDYSDELKDGVFEFTDECFRELGKAFECYRRALELREQLPLEADTPVAWENLLRTYTILLDPPARAIPADVRSEWLKRMAGTARMALDRFGMLRFATYADFAKHYRENPELYRHDDARQRPSSTPTAAGTP